MTDNLEKKIDFIMDMLIELMDTIEIHPSKIREIRDKYLVLSD